MEYLRTVAYMFRGQLHWARQGKGESPMNAVVRSVARKVGPVTLWWHDCREGHDVYTAKWFDTKRDVFEECELTME
jgi:hypothetical protein